MKAKVFLLMSTMFFLNKSKKEKIFGFNFSRNYSSIFANLCFKNNTLKCSSDLARPYFGASIRSTENGVGMLVVMIKSDSPAEIAKLKIKDVILEIEGKPINNIHDYNGAVGSEEGIKRVKIMRKVENQEKILEIKVHFIKH